MNPSVVLTVELPGNRSPVVPMVVGIASVPNDRGKCIPRFVQRVGKTRSYLLNPEMGDQCIVATATPSQKLLREAARN